VLAAPLHTATEKLTNMTEIKRSPQPEEIIADPEEAAKLA
jgi:hypothetical protein